MMFQDDALLVQLTLRAREGEISDDELVQLGQLAKAKKQHRDERAARIAGLKELLKAEGIVVTDLFSVDEISYAAVATGQITDFLKAKARGANRPAPKRAERPEGGWVRRKTGLVLVEVKLPGAGQPCRYCKGESLIKAYVARGFKSLDDGQLEANLTRYYTDAGREYFATEDGQVELARLIRFIKARKVNPNR